MSEELDSVCCDENWLKERVFMIRTELMDVALVLSDILVSLDKPKYHGFKTKARQFRVKSCELSDMLKAYRSETKTFEHNLKD